MVSGPISGLGSLGSLNSLGTTGINPTTETTEGFGSVLKNALSQVNDLSGSADQQIGNLLQGGTGDVSSVMIAVEKADVAFQLMMQVRNKIVNAYQDIEKMQF